MAFPLHPETPEEGQTYEDLFAGRNMDLDAVRDSLVTAATKVNLPYHFSGMTYNSRKAAELSKWAENTGLGDAFHKALFDAFFVHNLNIALMPVLQKICESIGLDPNHVEKVIQEGTYAHSVDDDWDYSRRMGVTAVPTFVVDRRAVVGAQPYTALEKLLESAHSPGDRIQL